jgi:Tfp pilus assembly protein PilO
MIAPRHAFALVLMLSALGGGWFGLLKPRFDAIEAAERKELQLKDDYKTLMNLAVNLDLYREQLVALDERFVALMQVLPIEEQLISAEGRQDVERQIAAVAKSLGMVAPKITAGPIVHEEQLLSTHRYNVAATGDFRQLVRFLQGISTGSARLWTVQRVSQQPSVTGLMLAVSLEAHGFVRPATSTARKKDQK